MQFFSRRNKVFLINNVIEKHFPNKKAFNQEIENLTYLRQKNIRVPQILSFNYPVLYLTYIDGENFCDILDTATQIQVDSLYNWLKDYHKTTNLLRGDINLRNFLINKDNSTFSVDFEEEIVKGDMEKDYGRLIAFIATYNPQFTDKKIDVALQLCKNLKKDNANFIKIEKYYFEEIKLMKLRRETNSDFLEKAIKFYATIKQKTVTNNKM